MSSPERAELLKNAIVFLQDPKSQSAPLAQRIQFLEAKGLTSAEIEEALRTVVPPQAQMQGPQYRSAYTQYEPSPYQVMPQPSRQGLDWRDYFIIAVVSGSFVYGAVSLAKKYLLPHLKPPTSTAYEADKDALSAQFDAAEALLREIQAETTAVKEAVEEQRQKVDAVTQDVETAVQEMREGELRNRDDLREIREEVNSIREMLPKMLEKNKENQNQSLAELQQELKSLKALLLSRSAGLSPSPSPSLPSFVGRPSIPSWQLSASSSAQSPVTSESGLSTLTNTTSSPLVPNGKDLPTDNTFTPVTIATT